MSWGLSDNEADTLELGPRPHQFWFVVKPVMRGDELVGQLIPPAYGVSGLWDVPFRDFLSAVRAVYLMAPHDSNTPSLSRGRFSIRRGAAFGIIVEWTNDLYPNITTTYLLLPVIGEK